MKRTPASTKLRKAACVIGAAFIQLLSTLDESEIAAVEDDPYDVLELALSKLPAATLRALKADIAAERRQPIPAAMRRAVLARDGQQCVICGHMSSLHLHHYHPVAEGGANATGNLVTLCANCHVAVHHGFATVKKPKQVQLIPAPGSTANQKLNKVPSKSTARAAARKRSQKLTQKSTSEAEGNSVKSQKPRAKADETITEHATKASRTTGSPKTAPKPVTGARGGRVKQRPSRQKTDET